MVQKKNHKFKELIRKKSQIWRHHFILIFTSLQKTVLKQSIPKIRKTSSTVLVMNITLQFEIGDIVGSDIKTDPCLGAGDIG